uniref:Uncharacterized protein n=1 Tax=Rangifer tarandus platyrhynchus TaxID=3082113 RepID=A0ACB0FMF7_RANTA|nr:unnamed protein product [Rangifer tarandus platyrhynchus]
MGSRSPAPRPLPHARLRLIPPSRPTRARCSHARPRPAPARERERARLQRTSPGGQPYWLSDCPNLRLRREEGGGDSAAGDGRERGGWRGLGGSRRPALAPPHQLWPDAGGRALAHSPLRSGPASGLDGGRARTQSPAPAGQGLVARAAEQTFGRGRAQV